MHSPRFLITIIQLASWGLVAGALTACTGPRGAAGRSDCSVSAGDGGSRTITCADGTSVSVSNGAPGTRCTVAADSDGGGAKTITCDDGTAVMVSDGTPGTGCTTRTGDGGLAVSCGDGPAVSISPDPPLPPTVLGEAESLPGLVVNIVSLAGASGAGDRFQVGDTLSVTFTIRTTAGAALPLGAVDDAAIWIAGPTSHYQRVLPAGRDRLNYVDVKSKSVKNPDGSYTYRFRDALPAAYGPPLYDTSKFSFGERTGSPLEHGSYTLAVRLFRRYTVGVVSTPDVGSATRDFLLGATAVALAPRQVVTTANCNQCHGTLQAHGGTYRDVTLCLTCHTAGSEDRNSTDSGDATPVTIELDTLMHKLHNGAHLPSVLGVGIAADGSRSYAAAPVPYVVGGGDTPSDFSQVEFPVWPSLSFPTPRNRGYSALTAAQQLTDDKTRTGVIACGKCHGDPDGTGPLAAPSQGEFAFGHPTRQACGACHDDVDWTRQYKRNNDTGMMAQPDDSKCLVCHPASGFGVGGSAVEGHRHPLFDPAFNPGIKVSLTAVKEGTGSGGNGNGKLDVGETVSVTIGMSDDSGAPLVAASIPPLTVVVTGPTTNRNLLLSATIPAAALTGPPPFTIDLPDVVNLELLGVSSATLGDTFSAARKPIWNVTGATPTLLVRTAVGPTTALAAAAPALQNFIEVASASSFLRNDVIVIDDGVAVAEEYLRIQWVDGNRLWFAAAGAAGYQPGLRRAHAAAAAVAKVTVATKVAGSDFAVGAASGTITELTELGAGAAVLLSYTTDFVVPAVYGPPLNDSPDLGEAAGKWKGLPLVPGTYTVGVWGARTLPLTRNGETNSYRSTSPPATVDFLVGSATTLRPVAIIASGAECASCHDDVYAHGGGRRGVDTCLLCHGSAGTEDRPRYVAPGAPATPGLTVEFRTMLHSIHRGSNLANAGSYTVVGFGGGTYPNNFGLVTYSEVGFPRMPSGVKDCAACHGSSPAWQTPADRTHPSAASVPARSWGPACTGCHDSAAAIAHADIMTSASGNESCATCHAPSRQQAVTLVHQIR